MLINYGADINATERKGRTPLDLADKQTEEFLVKHGAKRAEELPEEHK